MRTSTSYIVFIWSDLCWLQKGDLFLLSKYSNFMRCNFTCCTGTNCSANLWEGLRLPIVSWINSWWNLGLRDQMLDKVVMTRSRAIDQMVLYMYIPGEIKPWWEKYSLYWNCKQRNNNLAGFIFKRRLQQSWNLDLVLHVLPLHLLLLAQGVKRTL